VQLKNSAYFSNNKSKFVSLKRFLSILSFVLLIAIQSQGQSSGTNPGGDATERLVKMYPNPATSFITFDLQKDADKGLSIQVYSLIGKKMFETQNLKGKATVDLKEFNRGLYIYHLVDRSGKIIESGKFQVSH
jgi:Secretion system C-terminal sorting domain